MKTMGAGQIAVQSLSAPARLPHLLQQRQPEGPGSSRVDCCIETEHAVQNSRGELKWEARGSSYMLA